jgi:hypothetical protein
MPAVLERPPAPERVIPISSPDEPPETGLRRRRHWWRYLFPWIKTAVGAPIGDDALIIMNETDHSWTCAVGFRSLGQVMPHADKATSVVRKGQLSARRADAPADANPLSVPMTPSVRVVQITCDVVGGIERYDIWALSGPPDGAMRRGGAETVR